MKTILHRVISLAAAAALLLTVASSCDGTDAKFNTPENTIDPSDIIDPYSNGYISFSNLKVTIDSEDEAFNDKESGEYDSASLTASRSETSDETESDETESDGTNTDGTNTDNYIVIITQESTGEVVYDKTYAETLAESDMLTLTAGYYTYYVTSDREIPQTAWGEKVYRSSEVRIAVGDDNVTSLGSVVCRLATIKCQVAIAADMLAFFDTSASAETQFSVTLSYGDASLTYGVNNLYSSSATDDENEANTGYFAPQDGVSTIAITLVGMYNSAATNEAVNYIPISWTQSLSDIKSGQSRMISIKFDNYDSGQIQITLEVQGWCYDSALGVDIFSESFALVLEEDKLFDPDSQVTDAGAPTLTLSNGLAVDETYTITEYTFDSASETYSPIYKATLTPESGATIKSIYLMASSTNGLLTSAIEAAGYDDSTIGLFGEAASTNGVASYLTVNENSITKEVDMTLKYSAIAALYNYAGTHTFMVVAIDSQNRTSYTPLSFEVISTAGPTIVWEDGEFGVYQEISTDEALNVILKISSNSGIESLKIKFTSPLLTVSLLESLDLAEEIDIANTATQEMADRLSGFEPPIPVNDAIYGKTYIEVDISTFMPLLAELPYTESAAYTDFQITAADANGETVEVLKVVRYYSDEEIEENMKSM